MRFLLMGILGMCFITTNGIASANPDISVNRDSVIIKNGDHTATISRTGGTINLDTISDKYCFTPCLLNEAATGYDKGRAEKSAPKITRRNNYVKAVMHLAADRKAELNLTIEAYNDVPGIIVTSDIKTPAYYFWSWENNIDYFWSPGSNGPVQTNFKRTPRGKYGYQDWVFHPAKDGGLGIVTGGTVGDQGNPYLHSLPRELGKVTFAIAKLKSPQDAVEFRAKLKAHKVKGIDPWKEKTKLPKADYGKPAPGWLRDSEHYNGFYYSKDYYKNDQHVQEWLSNFSLIVGFPEDKSTIDELHKNGIRGIIYVNFMEIYGSAWGHKVNEDMDISKHPHWIMINENGEETRSLWGVSNNIQGLYSTCLHQEDLHENAVQFVKNLLEKSGADGVFIDNAGIIRECYGDKHGKHKHISGKSNMDMYEVLQEKIYQAVKSLDEDKIVMQNSGIMPSHWAYSDAQMYESTDFGFKLSGTMDFWQDLRYMGELSSEAIQKGKVPVLISYLHRCPKERKREAALGTYAYAKLYGFLWADWFELWVNDETKGLAKTIYGIRLGKPGSEIKKNGPVYYRYFENGVAVLNTGRTKASVSIPVSAGETFSDTAYNRTISAENKMINLEIEPKAGRILTR